MKETKQILEKANKLVGKDREKDYGDKVKNHENIAKLWSAYKDTEITAHDVAIMMTLLKKHEQNLELLVRILMLTCLLMEL